MTALSCFLSAKISFASGSNRLCGMAGRTCRSSRTKAGPSAASIMLKTTAVSKWRQLKRAFLHLNRTRPSQGFTVSGEISDGATTDFESDRRHRLKFILLGRTSFQHPVLNIGCVPESILVLDVVDCDRMIGSGEAEFFSRYPDNLVEPQCKKVPGRVENDATRFRSPIVFLSSINVFVGIGQTIGSLF